MKTSRGKFHASSVRNFGEHSVKATCANVIVTHVPLLLVRRLGALGFLVSYTRCSVQLNIGPSHRVITCDLQSPLRCSDAALGAGGFDLEDNDHLFPNSQTANVADRSTMLNVRPALQVSQIAVATKVACEDSA